MNNKPKVAFVCVHNSCRSQIAEALGKKLASDVFDSYSAGTEIKDHINPDAVRLMKQLHDIHMEESQYSKLISDIPKPDVVITMGCNVSCPHIPGAVTEDWGLDDPTGSDDEVFTETINTIENKIIELKQKLKSKYNHSEGSNMSKINNEPKIKNPLIVAIREQLEHRALWMYLLCDEAKKKGLDASEYAPEAIKRCGLYQGANLREKGGCGDSLKGLKKALFTKPAQWVFEMKIKRCTDDNLDIDFHYCPLVKAWQKQGCTDEEIETLCDQAMCGDRGIAESFGCVLELPATIAKGDDVCKIRFVRK